jgi:hypothetical protein
LDAFDFFRPASKLFETADIALDAQVAETLDQTEYRGPSTTAGE